jgi:hypothetical protein
MRKRLIPTTRPTDAAPQHDWLELDQTASVEVTSEAEGYPIEGALLKDAQRGWRAGEPGIQTIRLLFDHPQTIRVIRILFKEEERARTQEFVLRWMSQQTGDWKDVVRQQWNFSPPAVQTECEQYSVDLPSAAALELSIRPDIGGGETRASLQSLRVSVCPEI